jgi:hypothetical protein
MAEPNDEPTQQAEVAPRRLPLNRRQRRELTEAESRAPTMKRRPGRPPKRPWLSVAFATDTLLKIEKWHQLGLRLALRDPLEEPAFRRLMTRHRVPAELQDKVRAVMGRQRRYRDVVGLSEKGHRLARVLAARLDAGDDRHAKVFGRLLERQHGRRVARQIDLSRARGEPASSVASIRMPQRLMGLDGALDAWGAAQHDIKKVKTFRDWRRWAVAADKQRPDEERLLRSLDRQETPPVKRHRAQ